MSPPAPTAASPTRSVTALRLPFIPCVAGPIAGRHVRMSKTPLDRWVKTEALQLPPKGFPIQAYDPTRYLQVGCYPASVPVTLTIGCCAHHSEDAGRRPPVASPA